MDDYSTSAAFGGLKGKYDDFDGSLLVRGRVEKPSRPVREGCDTNERAGETCQDFMLLETEKLHALMRRYTSADENAFYPHLLPEPILPTLNYPRVLNPNRININDHIMNVYLEKILPGLTAPTSDASAVRVAGCSSSTDGGQRSNAVGVLLML